MREVDIMKRLDHPNIVKLFEVIDTDKTLYLVMEYANGGAFAFCICVCVCVCLNTGIFPLTHSLTNSLTHSLTATGEVFDYLVAHGRMKEREARIKFRQVCLSVVFVWAWTYVCAR